MTMLATSYHVEARSFIILALEIWRKHMILKENLHLVKQQIMTWN